MSVGNSLRSNKIFKILEILIIFLVAILLIKLTYPYTNNNPILRQSAAWLANITMLILVWIGLRLRGQSWKHFGLDIKDINLRSFLLSLVVFIAAISGFILGSIIMANITGIPESADMSGFNYLRGNLLMLLTALLSVFIVSSFGEEVIYRGFLITRISEIGENSTKWLKIAVLISAVIFGIIHFEWGPMGMVQTGIMGLVLGISFILIKRKLWILIFAHAYMNAILLLQMYFG